jgi:hypothetical protein
VKLEKTKHRGALTAWKDEAVDGSEFLLCANAHGLYTKAV